ncbi:hypothetical protein EUGRSUZ_E03958 [Eucalyptus grandis]|uniref:Uncharacterized protein n=2 Tax=Eucalyptus grandis TaxID=71139 RepID=A0ACC3L0Z3_EUCGR|nr:hypothetical protein EUGRSUZ_E03958 [Eucalyptus grandis]
MPRPTSKLCSRFRPITQIAPRRRESLLAYSRHTTVCFRAGNSYSRDSADLSRLTSCDLSAGTKGNHRGPMNIIELVGTLGAFFLFMSFGRKTIESCHISLKNVRMNFPVPLLLNRLFRA